MLDIFLFFLFLSVIVAYGFCCYRLAERLGYDGLMGVLLIVPVVNLVVTFMWAVSESPNELKIKTLERKLAHAKEGGLAEDAERAEVEAEALVELGSRESEPENV